MFKVLTKLALAALMLCVAGLVAASAADKVPVSATLITTCFNCATDIATPTVPGNYSLISDGFAYPGGDPLVLSNILTHNAVYTMDTSATLVNGLVAPSTRTVYMHFYSSVECGLDGKCPYPNNILPPCWGGVRNQDQAVNWSVFAPTSFFKMTTGGKYSGMARLNFNVRNVDCDRQVNRFRLEWPTVCITRTGAGTWAVTSQSCSLSVNWGEAHLQAYGGTKQNTVDYGDWRMPFRFTLTQ
jgi:hypothetical protein